jgi:hypothetical protein
MSPSLVLMARSSSFSRHRVFVKEIPWLLSSSPSPTRHPLRPQGPPHLPRSQLISSHLLAYLDDIVIPTNGPLTMDHVATFLSSRHSSLSLNRAKSTIDDVEDIRRTGSTPSFRPGKAPG